MTKALEINNGTNAQNVEYALWKYIQDAYEMDKFRTDGPRELKKLTDQHIYPDKISKMRVNPAVQVYSQTVADFIEKQSTSQGS